MKPSLPDPCQCVWDTPAPHTGTHCCGVWCARHSRLIASAIAHVGGWQSWVHTSPRARRALLTTEGTT